ncbi:MAG: aldehyde ferredoxin oxidoreductase family protein [Candidatus Acetothermia bacterium]
MFQGVWKNLLRVNLSSGETSAEEIDEELFQKYIGGSGLATKYLHEEVPANTDPLSDSNKLIFATGPFQGASIPGSAKWSVVSRSPLTNTFSVSTAGASWGVQFKQTGFDLLVIEGSADRPVFLWITDDTAEVRPAEDLWGEDAIDTVGEVQEKVGESNASVVTIGPAGENRVASACITADEHSFAGRTGLGAVMGAKNLKAIAAQGNKSVPIAESDELKQLNKELFKLINDNTEDTYGAHGTPNDLAVCEEIGDLPIKNWDQASWPEGAEKISAPRYTEKLNAQPWPCRSCPIGCHRKIETEYQGEKIRGAGAEYETLGMIGSNCLIDDLDAISKANDLCNRLGLDTISVGSYAAFTMEAYEKGLLSSKKLGTLKPEWGSGQFALEFIEQVGRKEGYGTIFENGFESAVEELGKKVSDLAVEVKNLALPAHDPRTHFSLAINYATSTRGACHLRGYPHVGELGSVLLPEIGLDKPPEKFSMEGQAELAAIFQDLATLQDSLVVCLFQSFGGMSLDYTTKLFNSVTGSSSTPEDLMEAGARAFNLQREINVGDGLDRADDRLPPRMFQPGQSGTREGKVPEPFEQTLLQYYDRRGWNNQGIPVEEEGRYK